MVSRIAWSKRIFEGEIFQTKKTGPGIWWFQSDEKDLLGKPVQSCQISAYLAHGLEGKRVKIIIEVEE